MNVKLLQVISLFGACLTTGLVAGLFAGFAYAVMPGLGRSDDHTFVEAMQKINVAILNGWFMFCFVGGLLLTVAALLSHVRSGSGVLPWIVAALVLYLVMFVITGTVNVPLNDELARAGEHLTDPSAVRAHFESKWVTWNIVRALVTTVAFAALAWALVLHGRAAATPTSALGTDPSATAHVVQKAEAQQDWTRGQSEARSWGTSRR
ncbi:anthrone oxygenase family protein [Prescottella soli]|uniref:Anthrone oxygenase family protein n=1 Tax=Prescottella soli TaxID=1543852 RepID=A0ABW9FYU9_9NOCA